MATKTLLKDITIRDKKKAYDFVTAVEKINNAKSRQNSSPTEFNREVKTLTKEQIIKIFGKKK